ncbi:HDOD domain-containing protein [Methylibium petroleiphilum]|uniref:HDOD domain-containing protein n=1 Tax=Methylibium petroleiphilum TaxID=105560 RepID=UPI001AC6970E|nr:HDOD domain-containing protein [Methylibium petroleiphilum]MBN9205802.1 HDOD domain-containing protein [Methylibium petroleiphilum]
MAIDNALRALDIDLPACPQTLVQLSLLMHDEDANLQSIGGLIETDMALASAVVRTVNSALFGLLRRVESVPEAVRYLGTREVAGLTFEIGLRGAFPPSPLLTALWARAGRRGLAMGRAAPTLDIDPWLAHTAGLFAESGQAALVGHDGPGYEALVATTPNPLVQLEAEAVSYGLNHAALGGALCQAWGLAGDVAASVRLRPMALRTLVAPEGDDFAAPWLTEPLSVQRLLALGAAVDAALEGQGEDMLARASATLGPLAGLDAALLHEAVAASVARLGDA